MSISQQEAEFKAKELAASLGENWTPKAFQDGLNYWRYGAVFQNVTITDALFGRYNCQLMTSGDMAIGDTPKEAFKKLYQKLNTRKYEAEQALNEMEGCYEHTFRE